MAEFDLLLQEDETKRQYLVDACCIAGAVADGDGRELGGGSLAPAWSESTPGNVNGTKRNPILGFLGDYAPPLGGNVGGYVPLLLVILALTALLFGLERIGEMKSLQKVSRPALVAKAPKATMSDTSAEAVKSAAAPDGTPEECLARLVETVDCTWVEQSPRIGESLAAGHRLRLESGCAKIAFGERAELILEGPADFLGDLGDRRRTAVRAD